MDVVITGSVAFDYLMTFPGYFKDHLLPDHLECVSLSFLVDSMKRFRGGVAPNIAYTMTLLGEKPKIWATAGEDFDEYGLWLESKGIDTSGVKIIQGEYTASFFANTDRCNAQIASFYPGAMAYAGEHLLQKLSPKPDIVIISPNEPDAMGKLVEECDRMDVHYVYDPSQQIVRLSGEVLQRGIKNSLALFANQYEFALIEKNTGWGMQDIFNHNPSIFVVVTRGADGVSIISEDGEIEVLAVKPESQTDPTGVGDAFRGGFLTGYSNGLDLLTCARMGVLAATFCLENTGPQGHFFSRGDFINRFRLHFDDRGKLDKLVGNNVTNQPPS